MEKLSIHYFHPGDLFGECFERKTTMFTSKALENCTLGIINRRELEQFMRVEGSMALEFIKWIGLMYQHLQTKLRDLTLLGKQGALASTLIRIANMYGKREGNNLYIKKRFTNTEIADLIGSSRETVNRMLSQYKRDNILTFDEKSMVILDVESLKKICHCEDCPKSLCRL
ncbi:Crp/Fnr family transcriptional regulator [Bacillus taeanensis]|uniref:Crp/Fnr family transcriptional regulator n=1 Tax=Bacillus taeanensis TaxID=273032 RepID=UPI0015F08128|nr:Crp/Fnr family transcriptional regulator [Bacillus taeanensis]